MEVNRINNCSQFGTVVFFKLCTGGLNLYKIHDSQSMARIELVR